MNVLLLGSDSRADTATPIPGDIGNPADSIMIAHIPSDGGGGQTMSIVHDTWVKSPGYGESKINTAMTHGGAPLKVRSR